VVSPVQRYNLPVKWTKRARAWALGLLLFALANLGYYVLQSLFHGTDLESALAAPLPHLPRLAWRIVDILVGLVVVYYLEHRAGLHDDEPEPRSSAPPTPRWVSLVYGAYLVVLAIWLLTWQLTKGVGPDNVLAQLSLDAMYALFALALLVPAALLAAIRWLVAYFRRRMSPTQDAGAIDLVKIFR